VCSRTPRAASPNTTSRSRNSCSASTEGQAALELVLHAAPLGAVQAALVEIAALPEVLGHPFLAPVLSERPL